ncbi:MAG TPA: glycosyltransferase, partial [Bacteroidota bacterium]|nr:glycosyltransferase [Bacteroidota bacterium]
MALTLFVSAVFFILYTYAVYPVILLVLHSVSPRRTVPDGSKDLSVSIVIAAYNEEAVLRNKIDNLLRLQLDRGRSEILIGSDGSTDGTNEILRLIDDSAIRSKCFATRRGKAAILNDLVSESSGEVIVFSDANTMYDANTVRHLIRHFSDPRVGAVCGELIFTSKSKTV